MDYLGVLTLIRERGKYMYYSEGETESKACKAAKEKLIENEAKK